jgi:hypothetical protein
MPRLTSLTTARPIYVPASVDSGDPSDYDNPLLDPINDSLDAVAVRTDLSGPFGGDVFSTIETGCDSTDPDTTTWYGDMRNWNAGTWDNSGPLTLEAWIKIDRTGNNLTFPDNFGNGKIVGMPIVSLYNQEPTSPTQTFDAAIILSVGVRDGDTTKWGIHRTLVNPRGANYNNTAAGSVAVDNNWHHIALVIYSDQTVNLFLDGTRVGGSDLSGATYRPNSTVYQGVASVWLFGSSVATGLPAGFDESVSSGCEGITIGQIRASKTARYPDTALVSVPTGQWVSDADTLGLWTPAGSNIGV